MEILSQACASSGRAGGTLPSFYRLQNHKQGPTQDKNKQHCDNTGMTDGHDVDNGGTRQKIEYENKNNH